MNVGTETDLHDKGRLGFAATKAAHQGHGYFEGARFLRAGGTLEGPDGAACIAVEESDLAALGGATAAKSAGAHLVLLSLDSRVAADVMSAGLRAFVRLPYRSGEAPVVRTRLLDQAKALVAAHPGIEGVVPTPTDEAMGLDTLDVFSACRAAFPSSHVVVDLATVGFKLGQLCLAFGADELFGPIGVARALRLGENAQSPVITEKEAAALVTAAGLVPRKRRADGAAVEP